VPGLTPSQTVGPYFSMRLPWPDGPFVVPEGTPSAITIVGRLYDGAGNIIPDGLIETWQASPDGRFAHPADPRGPVPGGDSGFRGFGRCPTGHDGTYKIVTLKHRLRHLNIGGEECIQSVMNHADGELRHPRNIHVKPRIRTRRQVHHAFCDVYSLVAHALQIGIYFDAGYNKAQINRHGLLHGQQVDGHFIHIALRCVDLGFVAQHNLAQ